jgi:hypothetical protein
MDFRIDPALDEFLADHVVAGQPLLPTVLQLDLAARAVLGADDLTRLSARHVVVGAPLTFPGGERRTVRVEALPSGRRTHVTLTTPGAVHLRAELGLGARRAGHGHRPDPLTGARIRGGVYPPFFHGPRFQVIGDRTPDPGTGSGVRAAWLAAGLPPLRWAFGPTVTGPRLLELLLQCCGLADLSEGYGLRVPASIEEVRWYGAAQEPPGAVAVIRPRADRRTRHAGDGRAFDGDVLDPDGSRLLSMRGYRTVTIPAPTQRKALA